MADYLNQITALIPQGVREKVLGNSGRELLAAVTDTLVVFGAAKSVQRFIEINESL